MVQPVCVNNKGFALLLSVLIVGSVVLSLSLILLSLSSNALRSAQSEVVYGKTSGVANACAEYTLNYLRSNRTWTGTTSLNLLGGVCQYTISNVGGNNRLLQIVGTSSGVTRRVKIITTAFTPKLVVGTWEEVVGF